MAQSVSPKSLDSVDDLMLARGSTDEFNHLFFSSDSDGDQNLSKSDYAKVIFCDLYYNTDSTVGCRVQIIDNVHEDPCDYIGLYKIGYPNCLSQCLASKLLSQTEYEDDGKMLRCTFKSKELPDLENGFYQFLYVTRDKEVCGASMPFEIKNTVSKDYPSDEDIVADSIEDDFLIVRSNVAEKNRQFQLLLDKMNEKCLAHESEMKKSQEQFKILYEEKLKLEQLLKKACEEKLILIDERNRLREERNIICSEKEETIQNLKKKNDVLYIMCDEFSCKLKKFNDLRVSEKLLTVAENLELQDCIKELTEDLRNKQKELEEKEKNQESTSILRNENSVLNSQLDYAQLRIEALEKSEQSHLKELSYMSKNLTELKQKFKVMKRENLRLKDSQAVHKKEGIVRDSTPSHHHIHSSLKARFPSLSKQVPKLQASIKDNLERLKNCKSKLKGIGDDVLQKLQRMIIWGLQRITDDDSSEFSFQRDLGSNIDTADEGVPEAASGAIPKAASLDVPLSQSQKSDSDTGKHVEDRSLYLAILHFYVILMCGMTWIFLKS